MWKVWKVILESYAALHTISLWKREGGEAFSRARFFSKNQAL